MIYQFRSNFSCPVPAQIVGERLEALTEQYGGNLHFQAVIADARPEGSLLHDCFTWDPQRALEANLRAEAERLIRNIYPIHILPDGTSKPVLGWVNTTVPDVGRCYITTRRAASEPELAERVEQEALAALESWRRRYDHIASLRGLFRRIDEAIAQAKRKRKVKT